MNFLQNIINLIDTSIKEDGESILTWWNIIQDWYDSEIDSYRKTINTAKDWLTNYQADLIDQTWISKLKIKYTNVSGYFIEISKSNLKDLPDSFIQRQTLVNSSRYITSELKEFEESLLHSESLLSEKEYKLFLEVRDKILADFSKIKTLGKDIAFLDFSTSLASIWYKNNYTRPKIDKKYDLTIEAWRHPVIEEIEKEFISNDLSLWAKNYVHIITWPNMGGKSTFLRQNALIVLMSHIGSFVPAKSAHIPLTDKIFSRVGASDNLYLWQSTFMVEMQEIANILHNSTKDSFVIIDEIGRGTSTYDGMSLAWAILKYNHDKIKSKTLFATHYHELIDESILLKWVSNYSVAVWENEDNLIFLRKIIPGWMKKSYGIQVAQIAWLHHDVVLEAKNMLLKLEWDFSQMTLINDSFIQDQDNNKNNENDIEKYIKNIKINDLTPMQALAMLSELQDNL